MSKRLVEKLPSDEADITLVDRLNEVTFQP